MEEVRFEWGFQERMKTISTEKYEGANKCQKKGTTRDKTWKWEYRTNSGNTLIHSTITEN